MQITSMFQGLASLTVLAWMMSHEIRLVQSFRLSTASTPSFTRRQAFDGPRRTMMVAYNNRMELTSSSSNEIMWIEEDEDDNDNQDDSPTAASTTEQRKKPASNRWERLSPRVKSRIVQQAQERAIANKKKREPAQTKKRRMMMFVKEQQRTKKQESRVKRPIGFDDRTPLAALIPGMEMSGVVISLTNFGAYVDVGTECDGLLHISQMSRQVFVEHPRQIVSPGDEVTVRVRSLNAEARKLHLTMLPLDLLQAEKEDDPTDRIPLDEIEVDDELWGQLKRITDFGAYVEVGAVVDGFLHFMDHPAFGWSQGQHPSDFMKIGDRVRVWASDVDKEQKRIKLTANRPAHLPGPRREF